MIRRNLLTVIIGTTLFILAVAIVAIPMLSNLLTTHASSGNLGARFRPTTTINGLNRISVVGSTQFIVDAKGHTVMADANPYGIAIVPFGGPFSRFARQGASLRPGDVVVTNFGGNQTGTTLVRFPGGMGPGHLFNTVANAGTKGPSMESFNMLTGSNWVANIGSNVVQAFAPNGTVAATIKSPLFQGVWGMAFNQGIRNPRDGSTASFFVSNTVDATIDRIDVIFTRGATIFRTFQIGKLTTAGKQTFIALVWVPLWRSGGRLFKDVLLATDMANNRIAAFPNSTTLNTTNARSNNRGLTVFQGNSLMGPVGLTVNPLNGDLLATNSARNDIVEINPTMGRAVADKLVDNAPVDAMTGLGSALFGVAATVDFRGNLLVYFTDDNTNTLDSLSF